MRTLLHEQVSAARLAMLISHRCLSTPVSRQRDDLSNSVHNLPPHLSYISKLHEIIQRLKCNTDELKQRLIDTWDHASPTQPLTTGKHGCVALRAYIKAKGRYFEHLLRFSHSLSEPL